MVSDGKGLLLGTYRVLLIDDEELVRITTADMLESFGAIVRCAASAAEAIAELDEQPGFDIVVSDLLMSGSGTGVLANEIARRLPAMPILIITGQGASSAEAAPFQSLRKPFRPDQLAQAVLETVRRGADSSD